MAPRHQRPRDAQALPPFRQQRARRRQRLIHARAWTDPAGDPRGTRPAPDGDRLMAARSWHFICELDELLPDSGVAALIEGHQFAIFRVDDRVYALDNFDPHSQANVLSRGIVGDLEGELVVA